MYVGYCIKGVFVISGDAQQLILTDPLYLGGVPPSPYTGPRPPQVWSVSGHVGCVRDMVVNGVSVQLADLANKQDIGSIHYSLGSHKSFLFLTKTIVKIHNFFLLNPFLRWL